jgi:signal transduction histidine kinase
LIEDDAGYARLIREILLDGYGGEHLFEWAPTLALGLEALRRQPVDVALVDLGLPDAEGLEAVVDVRAQAPRVPIVVLSGEGSVSKALESMRYGAQEYLVKGQAEHALLVRTIQYAAERKRAEDFEKLLIGIVSHDLRDPLGVISMTATTLKASPIYEGDTKRSIDRIARASTRCIGLVRDLLDLTNVRLGQTLPTHPSTADLDGVIRRTVDEFSGAHPGLDVRYTGTSQAMLSMDADRIAQMVMNLLLNARQHGQKDGPIEVSLLGEGATLVLRVHNFGPVIPAALRPRLFEAFQRAAGKPGEGGGGVGLGLFIVNEIVRAHAAAIAVTSSESEGTTFAVRFPAP